MMNALPELQSARLVLEPLNIGHAHVLYPSLLDERLFRFIPQDPPVSEDALTGRYGRLEARQSPDGRELWLNWAMRLLDPPTYVGTLEATVFPDARAAIAYMVFVPHQGQGYATEGVRRVLDYLESECKVATFVAEIDTRNSASIGLVEHLGFTRVATMKDTDFFKWTTSDEYRYELVKS